MRPIETEKLVARRDGVEFYEFSRGDYMDIDVYKTVVDVKGFAPYSDERVFFSRHIIIQDDYRGSRHEYFEVIQSPEDSDFIVDEDSEDFGEVRGYYV